MYSPFWIFYKNDGWGHQTGSKVDFDIYTDKNSAVKQQCRTAKGKNQEKHQNAAAQRINTKKPCLGWQYDIKYTSKTAESYAIADGEKITVCYCSKLLKRGLGIF